MQLPTKNNTISLVLLYIALTLHFAPTQAESAPPTILLEAIHHNATNSSSSTRSPWLARMNNNRGFPPGCRWRPWICNQDDGPRIRRRCCRNRCVDVNSDVNNCGLCGIRCPFTRQCCGGICVNTNRNPFHCGRCDHRCRYPIRCVFGLCGYAQPPFPFPPRRPKPPHRPKPPCGPRGGRQGPPPAS